MTQLTPNFSLEELTFSQTAARKAIDNTPSGLVVANLTTLCRTVLEPIRTLLGVPLHVDSGYRSPLLNAAVGGAADSAHVNGLAADLVPIGLDLHTAFDDIRQSGLPFDQLIIECNAWIHVSIPAVGVAPRGECLVASGGPGNWSYSAA